MKQLWTQDNAWKFNDKELKRLEIDYEGKGILALSAELWFPYSNEIGVSICYRLNGGKVVFLDKLKAGTPYPNKNIRSVQKRVGRKKTTKFIPIIFDNLDELYQVESVEIIWNIPGVEFVIVEYPIKFKTLAQKGIYVLRTHDTPAFVIANDNYENRQPPFINADSHIEVHNGSIYDDIVFFSMNSNILETIAEFHSLDSTFDVEKIVSFDDYLPSILPCVFEQLVYEMDNKKESSSSETLITYYRMNVELNDEGIITS